MKQRRIGIYYLVTIIVILVFYAMGFFTGSMAESDQAKVPMEKWYPKEEFGENYIKYNFEKYNKILYHTGRVYILGEEMKDGKIKTSATVFQDNIKNSPEVEGITPNYIIFSVKENPSSKKRKKIAIEIKETIANFGNETFHRCIDFDELSIFEKVKIHKVKQKEFISSLRNENVL